MELQASEEPFAVVFKTKESQQVHPATAAEQFMSPHAQTVS